MTTVPTDVEVTEEVIQSKNIEVETPVIDTTATEIDIDAPEEISEVSEQVEWAVNPIAANAPGPAEVFKYDKPNPRDKPVRFMMNKAPRASRNLSVLPKAFGDQDAPSMGELGPANINLFGTGDFFRSMGRMGSVHARSAVDAALHWLAVHQEADGHWDTKELEGMGHDVGVSSFALMAFLGAGNTTRRGDYRRNVLRGVEWLMAQQEKLSKSAKVKGAVHYNMYEHELATIALAEAYGRARDERVGVAARKAVHFLVKAQNKDGGWSYGANGQSSDMSVSGWGMQALKTAKLAQIKFDHSAFSRTLLYLDSMTDKGAGPGSAGGVGYTYNASQSYGQGSKALTPAGMVVRQVTGIGVENRILKAGAKIQRNYAPKWSDKNFYHWYYATYAMHNMGGEDRIWWNRRIRDVLLENQSRSGDDAGSWDVKGDRCHGDSGGRVYSTALGALCLEVYYRYSEALNSFGTAPDLDDLFMK